MSKNFVDIIYEKYNPINLFVMEGFDDCIIGYDFTNNKFIYSETLILQKLNCKMDFDDALDYYYFNIVDSTKEKVIICSSLGE